MSVTGVATLTTRPLNKFSDLDPKELVAFAGTATGDAGGGTATVTATFDQNRAFIVLWLAVLKESVASSEVAVFFIDSVMDAVTSAPQMVHTETALLLGTDIFTPVWEPPPILFLGAPGSANQSAVSGRMANTAVGDDVSFTGVALMFDLIAGANIPGAGYWPYRQLK